VGQVRLHGRAVHHRLGAGEVYLDLTSGDGDEVAHAVRYAMDVGVGREALQGAPRSPEPQARTPLAVVGEETLDFVSMHEQYRLPTKTADPSSIRLPP
jgi:hypothetical protein